LFNHRLNVFIGQYFESHHFEFPHCPIRLVGNSTLKNSWQKSSSFSVNVSYKKQLTLEGSLSVISHLHYLSKFFQAKKGVEFSFRTICLKDMAAFSLLPSI
jgi:hypothetical protein